MSKAIIDFSSSRFTDAGLSVNTNQIIEKMTDNSAFPDPDPSLETIQTANDNYFQSLDNAKNGTPEDTAIKNKLRKELEQLLHQVGEYVQFTSKGDELLILSAGFEVARKRETVGALPKPKTLELKPGDNKGSIRLICSTVPNASFYVFEYRELSNGDDPEWKKLVSTKHSMLIEGLTSGKQYAFRAAGGGSDDSRNWTSEIASYIL
ncbi:fibronectin type III domain-containing protein [Mangrovibacterium marinum]|uniref:Fibronectin type-III domain-containing protein n=1 Tax=Mangrovibacterium marinum TaxID=1639118 RepID=A0A2T5C010_9BACT|nr:fibronectin type III domain-containing protein [Mangrovibacterium marinum]PTN07900.1 hypothetical protein C8N47_11262 [Mangrovibacterium marinum]